MKTKLRIHSLVLGTSFFILGLLQLRAMDTVPGGSRAVELRPGMEEIQDDEDPPQVQELTQSTQALRINPVTAAPKALARNSSYRFLTEMNQNRQLQRISEVFLSFGQFAALAAQGEEGILTALSLPMKEFIHGYRHDFKNKISWPTRRIEDKASLRDNEYVRVEANLEAILCNFSFTHQEQKKRRLEAPMPLGEAGEHPAEPAPEELVWWNDDPQLRAVAVVEVFIINHRGERELLRTLWENGPIYAENVQDLKEGARDPAQPPEATALGSPDQQPEANPALEAKANETWYPEPEWVPYTLEETKNLVNLASMQALRDGNIRAPFTKILTYKRPENSFYTKEQNFEVDLIVVILSTTHVITEDDQQRDPYFSGRPTHGHSMETVRYDYIDPTDGNRVTGSETRQERRNHQFRGHSTGAQGWQWFYTDAQGREQIVTLVYINTSNYQESYVTYATETYQRPPKLVSTDARYAYSTLSPEDIGYIVNNGLSADHGVSSWWVSNGRICSWTSRKGLFKAKHDVPLNVWINYPAETRQVPVQQYRTVYVTNRVINCLVDSSKNANWNT